MMLQAVNLSDTSRMMALEQPAHESGMDDQMDDLFWAHAHGMPACASGDPLLATALQRELEEMAQALDEIAQCVIY